MLALQSFPVRSVPIVGPTRQNIKLQVGGQHIEINEPGPQISAEEIARFEEEFCPDLAQAKVLVLSGSLPQGIPHDYYARLIEKGTQLGLRVILDTSGEPLRRGVGPILVKPNRADWRAAMPSLPDGRSSPAPGRWCHGR